jgi:hypothetical protein
LRIERVLPLLLSALPLALALGCVAGTARKADPDAAIATADTGLAATPDSPISEDLPGNPAGIDGPGIDSDPVDADFGEAGAPLDGGGTPDVNVPVPDTAPSWWPAPFVPGGLPDPSNGRGNHAGSAGCLSCHKAGGAASSALWSMGGIVFASPTGTTGVASAEIGIKDGAQFYRAYSASNGYFWLPTSAGAINWATAEIRIRSAKGESPMVSKANSGDCQACHSAGNRIFSP